MYARFEVAVARQDRDADQIVLHDRVLDGGIERARTTHAGRAAIPDEVEAELFEIREQPRLLQVLVDDPRSRRERSFDARIYFQSALDGFFSEQPRREHYGRIRRIGARSDRRDQHVAVSSR